MEVDGEVEGAIRGALEPEEIVFRSGTEGLGGVEGGGEDICGFWDGVAGGDVGSDDGGCCCCCCIERS